MGHPQLQRGVFRHATDTLAVREAPPQSALDSKVVPDQNVSSPTYAKIDRRLSSRCRGTSESPRSTAVVVSSDCRDPATNLREGPSHTICSREQGWISATKPKQIQILKRGENSNIKRVAISDNSSDKKRPSHSPDGTVRTRQSDSSVSSDEEHGEIHNSSWLPSKIKQCGEVVGVTLNECEGGWDGVIRFAEEKDRQNRAVIDLENKKTSGSGLNNVLLNYLRKEP